MGKIQKRVRGKVSLEVRSSSRRVVVVVVVLMGVLAVKHPWRVREETRKKTP